MAQQPSRELASTDQTKGAQDAGIQELGFSPAISLDPRSRLQHLQRPTPPLISPNAPRLSGGGDEHVARGTRGRLKICETQAFRVLVRQRDNAGAALLKRQATARA